MTPLQQFNNQIASERLKSENKAVNVVYSKLLAIHYNVSHVAQNQGISTALIRLDEICSRQIFEDLYFTLYNELGRLSYENEKLRNEEMKRGGFNFFDVIWRDMVLRALSSLEITERITEVTEYTKTLYRKVLLKAAELRLNPRDVAKLFVQEKLSLVKWRALRIARTELTHANAIGADYAMQQVGVATFKMWIHTLHGDYREAHAAINGHYVKTNEKFQVNGKEMKYPGDPAGGASEVVNCRCSHVGATERTLRYLGRWKG